MITRMTNLVVLDIAVIEAGFFFFSSMASLSQEGMIHQTRRIFFIFFFFIFFFKCVMNDVITLVQIKFNLILKPDTFTI